MSLAFIEKDNRHQEWVLALSLGHNSSAILAKSTGEIINGFEEERITKVKSDSSFPINAVMKCLDSIIYNHVSDLPIVLNVGIGHWFNNDVPNATWNRYYLDIKSLIEKFFDSKKKICIVKRVETSFNHHKTHADSIRPFIKNNINNDQLTLNADKPTVVFVADGFGNQEEVLSIYEYNTLKAYINGNEANMEYKLKNLKYSLGLMYQYITSAVGMKENQDEYKFLGYESHIQDVVSNKLLLDNTVKDFQAHMSDIFDYSNWSEYNDYDLSNNSTHGAPINIEKLLIVKDFYHEKANTIISLFKKEDDKFLKSCFKNEKRSKRILLGYILQQSVENIVLKILQPYLETHNICTVGGLFYNVKLNNRLMVNAKNLYCVMPLAGDQGCNIGILDTILRQQYHTTLQLDKMNFGKRQNDSINSYLIFNCTKEYYKDMAERIISKNNLDINNETIDNIVNYAINNTNTFKNIDTATISAIYNDIKNNEIVNLVYGNLEFGPRALCYTTSLALPNQNNVMVINDLNDRDTVMPMAPVMLKENDTYFFSNNEVTRVIGSDRYMILTYIYNRKINEKYDVYGGVMHKVQSQDFEAPLTYSGRPQFLYQESDNPIVFNLLSKLNKELDIKAMINTSYNVHGTPIVYDVKDATDNFIYQVVMKFHKNIDKELKLYLQY